MPRRKYGHMVGPCPPNPQEKCRLCILGYPCPAHRPDGGPPIDPKGKKKKDIERMRSKKGKKGKKKQRVKKNEKVPEGKKKKDPLTKRVIQQ